VVSPALLAELVTEPNWVIAVPRVAISNRLNALHMLRPTPERTLYGVSLNLAELARFLGHRFSLVVAGGSVEAILYDAAKAVSGGTTAGHSLPA